MTLRPYRTDDLAAIADLFYQSVHTLCRGDYTEEQLDAWATGHIDEEAWDTSFRARHTLVAEENGALLGFADMAEDGYLDRLYVHPAHTGKGVATALVNALEPPLSTRWKQPAPPFGSQRTLRRPPAPSSNGAATASKRNSRSCAAAQSLPTS